MRRGVEWWLGLRWLDRRLLTRSLPLWYGRLPVLIGFAGIVWIAATAITLLTLSDYWMAGPEDDPGILSADVLNKALLALGCVLLAIWLLMVLLRERQDTPFGRLHEVRAWYLLGGAFLFLAPAFLAPTVLTFNYVGFDRGVEPGAPIEQRIATVEEAHAELAGLQRGLVAIREVLLIGSAEYPESAFEGGGYDDMNMYGAAMAVETDAAYVGKFIRAESARDLHYLGMFAEVTLDALKIAGTSGYRIDDVALNVSRELTYLMSVRAWMSEIQRRMPDTEVSLGLFAGSNSALRIKAAVQGRLREIEGQLAPVSALVGGMLQVPPPELDGNPPRNTFEYHELPQATKDLFSNLYQRFSSLPLSEKKRVLDAAVRPVQALHELSNHTSEASYFVPWAANKSLSDEIRSHADTADQVLRALRLLHPRPPERVSGDSADTGLGNYNEMLPSWVRPYLPVALLIVIAPAIVLVHVARRMGLMMLLWVGLFGIVASYVVGAGLSLGTSSAQAVQPQELGSVSVVWSGKAVVETMLVQAVWLLPLLFCVALLALAAWRGRISRRFRIWTLLALFATALGTGMALGIRAPLFTVDPAKVTRASMGGEASPIEVMIAHAGGETSFEYLASGSTWKSANAVTYGLGIALLVWAALWDLVWAAMRRVLSLPE